MPERTRLVRWVGHPAPFESRVIRKKLALGVLPSEFVESLRWFESNYRLSASPKISRFTVGPEHGFTRTYQFGEHVFEQEMAEPDWQRLIAHPLDRVMFVDLGENPHAWRTEPTGPQWEELVRLARGLRLKRPTMAL